MVTIKYYTDPVHSDPVVRQCDRVSTWLRANFTQKSEILDLRFFKNDMLGEEIDTSDISFLDISDGQITVVHDSALPRGPIAPFVPYILTALVVTVATVLLTPKPKIGATTGSSSASPTSESSTNTTELGAVSNVPRLNKRIDDIFGYVKNHVPPLWQVPYRIGVDDVEVEVLLLCVGRGKYQIDAADVRDGDSRIRDIPNSSVSVYGPGTYPGNGTPELQIGADIDQPIGIYSQSNELNTAELDPPNEVSLGGAIWGFTGINSTTGRVTLTNRAALGVDLRNIISVGDLFDIQDSYYFQPAGNITLYTRVGVGDFDPVTFARVNRLSLNGVRTVTAVTIDTVTLTDGSFTNWTGTSNYVPPSNSYNFNNSSVSGVTLDSSILDETHYSADGQGGFEILFTSTVVATPNVRSVLDGTLGPFAVPENATKVLINMAAFSGFYDVVNTDPVTLDVEFEVTFEELDSDGLPTGNSSVTGSLFGGNKRSIRGSSFRSYEFIIPYSMCRISAKRTTDRIKASNRQNNDRMEWRDLYFFEPLEAGVDFGDVTLAHVLMTSNTTSRLIKERQINMDVTRKITQYLGDDNLGPEESFATDQFDQILIHTALDPQIGRLTLSDINADNIVAVKNQISTYFGEAGVDDEKVMTTFGYDFDNSQLTFQDTFSIIADVVNCFPYVQNGVFDIFFERMQTSSTLQVTHRNKLVGSESRKHQFRRRYDGVELTYRSRETGLEETIYIPDDRSATNPDRQELTGCTTELQAYRRARRIVQKQIYNTQQVVFDMDEFGRMIVPGQRIDSPDGTRFIKREGVTDGYRIFDGEVVEVDGLNVELSQPVEFTDGEDHYISFTKLEGDNTEQILCTATDDPYIITLQAAPTEAVYDGYQRDRTKFVFASEQLRGALPLIPQTIEFSLDNANEINTITSINYTDRYYDGDQETP